MTNADMQTLLQRAKAELLPALREMAIPVDVDDLVRRGILKKRGKWYLVLRRDDVPQHAWRQILGAGSATVKGQPFMLVRFKDTTKMAKRLLAKYENK